MTCITESIPSDVTEIELCFASRGMFAGYLGDENATTSKLLRQSKYYKSGVQGAKLRDLLLISKRLDNYLVMSSGKQKEN